MKQTSSAPVSPKDLLIEAGVNFSVAAVLPTVLSLAVILPLQGAMGEGFEETLVYRYLSFALPQICFAAAAVLWFCRRRKPLRTFYTPCKWYFYPLALALAFGLLFAFNQLNESFVRLLELIGYRRTTDEPVTQEMLSGGYLALSLLVIAILPAFFEETIFRGVQISSMRESGWGTLPSVLICGAMFSLFHGNPEQTPYQFLCGVCYALLAERSGSPFPSMLAHFANNAAILVLGAALGTEWTFPQTAEIAVTVSAAVVFVAAVTALLLLGRKTRRKGGTRGAWKYFLASGAGIAMCALQWILLFVTRAAA